VGCGQLRQEAFFSADEDVEDFSEEDDDDFSDADDDDFSDDDFSDDEDEEVEDFSADEDAADVAGAFFSERLSVR
jgi:ribonuclease E